MTSRLSEVAHEASSGIGKKTGPAVVRKIRLPGGLQDGLGFQHLLE